MDKRRFANYNQMIITLNVLFKTYLLNQYGIDLSNVRIEMTQDTCPTLVFYNHEPNRQTRTSTTGIMYTYVNIDANRLAYNFNGKVVQILFYYHRQSNVFMVSEYYYTTTVW